MASVNEHYNDWIMCFAEAFRGTTMGLPNDKHAATPAILQKHYGHLRTAALSLAGAHAALSQSHWPCCSTLLACISVCEAFQTYHGNPARQPGHMQMTLLSFGIYALAAGSANPLPGCLLSRRASLECWRTHQRDQRVHDPLLTTYLQSTQWETLHFIEHPDLRKHQ